MSDAFTCDKCGKLNEHNAWAHCSCGHSSTRQGSNDWIDRFR